MTKMTTPPLACVASGERMPDRGARWYGHVLRRDDNSVLRVALDLEVSGNRKRGRAKKTWKKQVDEETEKVGLKKADALNRDKWRDGLRVIAEEMG